MISWLQKIFGKESLQLNDYSWFRADMHSHLIPGIDDGAPTIDHSLELIKQLQQLGFSKLVTTPHIMSDFYKNDRENILQGLQILREAVIKENIPVTIEAAAEYYYDSQLLQKLSEEKLLTFGENYLLFEISYINPPEQLKNFIFNLRIGGYRPVLAHPERYPYWFNQRQELQTLKDSGVLFQININSVAGYYGPEARILSEYLIDNNLVDFIGTDTHSLRHIEALKKTLTHSKINQLLQMNILNRFL